MAEQDTWQEADLLQLVSEQADESLELDFKESGALQKTDGKKRDLSKDVSAFANSAGGTLIYGMIEDQETHAASALDDGFDPTDISKEWVEQVISSNIQPRISGVRIHAVDLSTHNPGNVAYVVTVPKSSTAHQAADKRYYKRFNFESVSMEDYELRDVMQRADAPELTLETTIGDQSEGTTEFLPEAGHILSRQIDVYAVNAETAGIADYSQFHIFWPTDVSLAEAAVVFPSDSAQPGRTAISSYSPSDTVVEVLGNPVAVRYFELQFAPGQMVLFPGERRWLASFRLKVSDAPGQREEQFIVWRIRAPRSNPSAGALVLVRHRETIWQF
ncbi:MAG: ATP-binding protein [Chloroflexi bacterium]|nr:ATP-binding protein [Chloroflexota bacterium]